MKENKAQTCSPPEDIVAYLYGEMNARTRGIFEVHLADCERCTSELADLSFARLEVYEWHRDEFLELESPRIIVPFAQYSRTSWIHGLRAFFAARNRTAFAGGVFSLIAFALAGSYIAFKPAPNDLVRESNVTPSRIEGTAPAATPAAPAGRGAVKLDVDEKSEGSTNAPAVRVSNPVRGQPARAGAVDAKPKRSGEPRRRTRTITPPRLNDFEDEEDTTLRLGDLLAEIDAKD